MPIMDVSSTLPSKRHARNRTATKAGTTALQKHTCTMSHATHHDGAPQQHPQDGVPRLRASLEVALQVTGVDVRNAHEEAWPGERLRCDGRNAASAVKKRTLIVTRLPISKWHRWLLMMQ
jgi:hypothetical protein